MYIATYIFNLCLVTIKATDIETICSLQIETAQVTKICKPLV